MSEPWENTRWERSSENCDQPDGGRSVDKTAKYILMAGLALSLTTLVVGTVVKETNELLGKIKDRARNCND